MPTAHSSRLSKPLLATEAPLNDGLPEVYVARAFLAHSYHLNWEQARYWFDRALLQNPNMRLRTNGLDLPPKVRQTD